MVRRPVSAAFGNATLYWVMATLAVAMTPQILSVSPVLGLFVLLPLTWRVLAARRRWRAPGFIWRMLAAGAGVGMVILLHGSLVGRQAGASLLTVMLALKLIESYRLRDTRIVVSLSFFLAATQFLFHSTLFMLVYAAAVVVLGLIALHRLTRDQQTDPAIISDTVHRPDWRRDLRQGLGITALAIPAAVLLFVLFPRLANPLWGVPDYALDAKTGLSGEMSPGSIQSLFVDDSPAFRVTFDGPVPPPLERYWRGPVFWDYDGRTWDTPDYYRGFRAQDLPPDDAADYRYRVQLEPHERRWLFALDYPINRPRRSFITRDFQMISYRPVTALKSYTVASDIDHVDSPELLQTFRKAALALPEDRNPRTLELIREWRAEHADDGELINRILRHFREQPFAYTLRPAPLSYHGVDDFLFNTREGYCEHYASAFTVMMRMAGIPARVVTGYQGGYQTAAGYLLVRQSDAHAWSEVWLPGRGWQRVDPTAAVSPSRIEDGALAAVDARRTWYDFPWVRQVQGGLDILQNAWNEWVLSFNADRQSRLLERFGLPRLSPMLLAALLVAALSITGLVLYLALAGRGDRQDPAARLYRRFLRRLARRGIQRRTAETASELSRRAATELPQQASTLRRIARAYNLARYRDRPDALQALRQAISEF